MDNPFAGYVTSGRTDERLLARLAENEKMAELGRLSVGMVHELNSPLSVIASAVQLILREDDVPPAIHEMMERIDAEIHRLSQLAKGVLSFARNGDEAEPDPETDVNQVLREVTTFLRYEARKRRITIIEELEHDLPCIASDRNRLKQVCINLMMNSFQAMDNGGALLIRTYTKSDNSVRIDIADTGCGIPPERIEQIFDAFYTTKKAGDGTGLGLFIVREMIQLMHGRIEVASREGEGTTFTIMLPLS